MNSIQITIIYALSNIQYIKTINMKIGSTVKDAILESNILTTCKNISLYKNKIGIYNKIVHLNRKIKNGDRIEIYRSLTVDPKERRRKKFLHVTKKNNYL